VRQASLVYLVGGSPTRETVSHQPDTNFYPANAGELKERSYQTVTQVKGLSPEKQNIIEDDLLRKREVNTIIAEIRGEDIIALSGSETTV